MSESRLLSLMMSNQSIFSLYRTYLRQVSTLPHIYLRHFFRIKGADDFRSVLKTDSVELRRKKLRRVYKDVQRLRAANGGESTAFDRMLDMAYGRVGRLRWELMEPLLLGANAPLINPWKEKTCSPAYSPELVALLTSGISRTTRPLQKHQLVSPPGLRGRAKSVLQDTVLLGPPSRRREYNIRWRFFKNEWKKVYPPLEVSLQHPANHTDMHFFSNPPFSLGFQRTILLQELLALAGSPSRSPQPPSKQRRRRIQNMSDAKLFDGGLSVRWLRRRYQALLGRVPLLILRTPLTQDGFKRTYDVQLANNAITTSRTHASRLHFVDMEDVSWISDINLIAQSGRRRE